MSGHSHQRTRSSRLWEHRSSVGIGLAFGFHRNNLELLIAEMKSGNDCSANMNFTDMWAFDTNAIANVIVNTASTTFVVLVSVASAGMPALHSHQCSMNYHHLQRD